MTLTRPSYDAALALRADPLFRPARDARVLDAADIHVASRLGTLAGEQDPLARLALALAVRAVRKGSTCLDLGEAVGIPDEVRRAGEEPDVADLLARDWPTDAAAWRTAVAGSALASAGVLAVEHDLVYLDRYRRQEVQVAQTLTDRLREQPPQVAEDVLAEGLRRLFPQAGWAEQSAVAGRAVRQWTTVLTGGPGTGKTTTVAGILALLAEQHEALGGSGRLRVGLAAPTGKAAARLQESIAQAASVFGATDQARVSGLEASTLHRLLGWNPRQRNRFRHGADNRLPHDVIVVDETSMVDLTMMARLLEAVRPRTRLLLVGDPDQLASVDAGAVLADLVDGYQQVAPDTVARLLVSRRFDESIGAVAAAIRDGDADRVVELLRDAGDSTSWIEQEDPTELLRPRLVERALRLRRLAADGDVTGGLAALGEHRLLCARRTGSRGVTGWNRVVDQWLSEATGDPLWDPMYVGRPLLVTRNDYALGLLNGDSGLVVAGADGAPTAAMVTAGGVVQLGAGRLSDVETMHAMTVHKSQGSEAPEITVLLPEDESPMLVRELLYTAVTRAGSKVTVVGSEEAVRTAVATRIRRASGLRQRLQAD
ncbi:exodeoxyribonuclease V subunit alpha [Flexivirga sp. ID2601S]|uniref:RecBCD enzyme subunit RecD n=1 Tax=Flexivirga aerilata TaxID=1656889 RepID=A0A849AFD1_9MICO|nr:exodeoxyribonuclease V subunit alpha [Flexivirga aerilata]NNG38543.1 exodeoxyribonuclease V subunit alpha [Flexivirga aerilata]